MIVFSVVYQLFYKVLRAEFIKKEFDGIIPEDRGEDTPTIWDKTGKNGKALAVTLFIGGRSSEARYFYRKNIELNPKRKDNGRLDNLAFCKGLEYIGMTPPEEINSWHKKDALYRAEVLLDKFLDIFSNDLPDEVIKKQRSLSQSDSLGNDNTTNNKFNTTEEVNSDLTAAKLVVQKFYESIAVSDYLRAWQLMSPEFQKRKPWEGNFEKFQIGYTNTNSLRQIIVFDISQNVPNLVTCRITYDDDIAAYTNKELAALESMTVADIDVFSDTIKKLKNKLENGGLQDFDKIELHKLFEHSASEYIWYKCNYDPNILDKLFDTQRSIVVRRMYDCSCKRYGEKWLINKISAVKTFSAR